MEQSLDTEESVREEKREDVKKQQPIQFHSCSDSKPSRNGLLQSLMGKYR